MKRRILLTLDTIFYYGHRPLSRKKTQFDISFYTTTTTTPGISIPEGNKNRINNKTLPETFTSPLTFNETLKSMISLKHLNMEKKAK
ncbi:CLUMA_CG012406, isoform A [Clunio marinus]|uniref:CLUMA_CG012406, isoform A n=1 Tax=Clunio marinus TaxID=568069 RepID=A0A1J1IF82_9DIPT|nr:CLUMA_CG012406, isoform A [Clunio marinus]